MGTMVEGRRKGEREEGEQIKLYNSITSKTIEIKKENLKSL